MATTWDTHKNLSSSTVATVPTPAASGTTLIVVDGSSFPAPTTPYNCTIWPANAVPTPSNSEIVRVTALSTNTMTITRIQESSSARAITVGDNVALTVTKKALTDIETAVNTLEGAVDNGVCEGRLTLTTAVPVTTADVAGAVSIFYTPYTGNRIALYSGTTWNVRTFTEITIALGTITSGLPYDIFAYDNSGVVACEILAWTNGTTRATALVTQDGVLSKTGVLTRRYLGSFYTTATTTTEDSIGNRYLYNYYNRVDRNLQRFEATANWNYGTNTIRQANAAAANQVNFLIGVNEDPVVVDLKATFSNASGVSVVGGIGIGLDSTTTFAGTQACQQIFAVNASGGNCAAQYRGYTGVGKHSLMWLECGDAAASAITWYGASAAVGGAATACTTSSGLLGFMKG